MADEDKDKAEKVAAAKKRVCAQETSEHLAKRGANTIASTSN